MMYRRRFVAMAGGFLAALPSMWAAAGPMPLRRLRLANAHTGENFDGPFRDDLGPIKEAIAELSLFLRDHHSGETIAMDIGVLDFLVSVMDAVGATKATILSAYRTRETNVMLAKTTFGVADNSQHIFGRALDVRLDGRNEEAMQAARTMLRGGVGWYPRSGFFHLDSGPVRNWTLDGRALDSLLLYRNRIASKNSRKLIAGQREYQLVLPGLEQSGQPLPSLANSGRPLAGLAQRRRALGSLRSGRL
jgi:uncharacterized protein YcbK (DUF882 family)